MIPASATSAFGAPPDNAIYWRRERSTDGFGICPVHGDVLWDQHATSDDACETQRLTPTHPEMRQPRAGDEMRCFCGQGLRFGVRPCVRVVEPCARDPLPRDDG